MGKQVDLEVYLSEQRAKGIDVVESEMVRINVMKGVQLIIRCVKEGQDEASGKIVTRDREFKKRKFPKEKGRAVAT